MSPTPAMSQELIEKIRAMKSEGATNQVIHEKLGVSMGSVSKFSADIKKPQVEKIARPKEPSATAMAVEAKIDREILDDVDSSPITREATVEKMETKSETAVIKAQAEKLKAEVDLKRAQELHRQEVMGITPASDPMVQMRGMAESLAAMMTAMIGVVKAQSDNHSNGSNPEMEVLRRENAELRQRQAITEAITPLAGQIEELKKTVAASRVGSTSELDIIGKGVDHVGTQLDKIGDRIDKVVTNPAPMIEVMKAFQRPLPQVPPDQKKIIIGGLKEKVRELPASGQINDAVPPAPPLSTSEAKPRNDGTVAPPSGHSILGEVMYPG